MAELTMHNICWAGVLVPLGACQAGCRNLAALFNNVQSANISSAARSSGHAHSRLCCWLTTLLLPRTDSVQGPAAEG